MRLAITTAAFLGILVLGVTLAEAQPGGGKKDKGPKGGGTTETVDDFVRRIMAFNDAKDGKLTKKELTDTRLHALFDRADTNKDGIVTRAELEALYAKESLPASGGFGGDKGDKKGFGEKGFGDKKGKGFKGGPQPGVVLPTFLQDVLDLSETQRKQVADLQKEVDARLDQILTADQKAMLREIREKGPKGPPPDKK